MECMACTQSQANILCLNSIRKHNRASGPYVFDSVTNKKPVYRKGAVSASRCLKKDPVLNFI